MRSRIARRLNIPAIVDLAIAITLVCVVTFFIVVMEYCVGNGELTRAELLLLDAKTRVAHAPAVDEIKN